jgi:hypothetical protein
LDGDISLNNGSAGARVTIHMFNRRDQIMEQPLMEWGPAHLREEAPRLEIELDERPDDN